MFLQWVSILWYSKNILLNTLTIYMNLTLHVNIQFLHTKSTVHVSEGKSMNFVQENNGSLFWESHKTYNYDVLVLSPAVYRVSRGECARLRENVPYVKVHRYYPKHLYPKLNGYGHNGDRKVWPSCGSTYCSCFTCCYPYTAHVHPSVSQPSQAHSAFIINRCHSYSEL